MKTAVSVPDDLFATVDRLARRSHRSRSEVYSAALREYVARHPPISAATRSRASVTSSGAWQVGAGLPTPGPRGPGRRLQPQLAEDSVANVSQLVTLDRSALTERVGRLSAVRLELVLSGIAVVLGRP